MQLGLEGCQITQTGLDTDIKAFMCVLHMCVIDLGCGNIDRLCCCCCCRCCRHRCCCCCCCRDLMAMARGLMEVTDQSYQEYRHRCGVAGMYRRLLVWSVF
jgi:hypothetical protein